MTSTAASEGREQPSLRDFFASRFVQAILLSGLFLQIGIWVRNFAILFYVTDLTGNDPNAVSLISVAEFLPIFLFSFIGGTFADRWRPKRTMVWCDLLSAVSVLLVLLTLLFGTWKAVFFATLVSSILSQFSQPSGMRLFKQHVHESQLQLGMSVYQTMMAVFMILGPSLGTLVYYNLGIDWAMGIMCGCFVLSAVTLMFLPPDRAEDRREQTHIAREMALGFKYVLSRRLLTMLGVNFAVAGLAIGLIMPMSIFLVTEHLGLDKSHLQWFTGINGAAMIVGGGLAMAFSKKASPQSMLAAGMAVSVVAIAAIGTTSSVAVALVAQFISGLVMPAIQIAINTLILQNTEDAFVGRVNGILNPLFMGAMVLTMSVAGLLKDAFSLSAIYLVSSGLFVLGVLVMLPMLRVKK
ncbi:MFS transporter [Gordoniibacillus kamchatkensis]|uniref:MFS transporter n=1 Tax=Gordoniibacillus kamchatkensis TaxID=1590651 RepID=A0ABR5AJ55_9BACL|nr:MFS transporter [Paenibacillus sp. VKM B-2647]KIL41085.1 MFS transporter [Paenibacillus sp. VKM B-2647]